MSFSPSPQRQKVGKKLRKQLTGLLAELQEFDAGQPDARKALKKLVAQINEVSSEVQSKSTATYQEIVGEVDLESMSQEVLRKINKKEKKRRHA